MVENLEPFSDEEYEETYEGTFKSTIFKDDDGNDELVIYIEDIDFIDYAEQCVEHLNSLSDSMLNTICKGIIKNMEEFGGMFKNFKLPNFKDPKEVLSYCWFTALYVEIPRSLKRIAYTIEGEGDWGESIQIAIRGKKVLYVGRDTVSPWENVEYYKYLDDNGLYL